MWAPNSSLLVYSLHLGFYCLLLATVLRIGLAAGMHFAGGWISTRWRSTAPSVPYITSKIIGAGVEVPSVSRMLISVIIFCLGYITSEASRYNNIVSYRMDVIDKYSDTQFLVREIDGQGNPVNGLAGQPHLWKECLHEMSKPDLEPGMRVDVVVEDLGCKSFADQNRTGWKIARNEATGKFIDYRGGGQ